MNEAYEVLSDAKKRIYNNKPVAWFSDDNDPNSLQFAKGFAPDFENGLIASSSSRSKLYGGAIMRFRICSHSTLKLISPEKSCIEWATKLCQAIIVKLQCQILCKISVPVGHCHASQTYRERYRLAGSTGRLASKESRMLI